MNIPAFEKYRELLLKWNQKYNLTSIVDPNEIWIKHFEDSLSLLPYLSNDLRILDVGCGAGFPGIPLKIEDPTLEIVLLDSIGKKIQFCDAVIRELKLNRIQTQTGRAEDEKMIHALGLFDVVVSRATFAIQDFLKISAPYLKSNGRVIVMKSRLWSEEKFSHPELILEKVIDYSLSKNMGERSLLIFKKNVSRGTI